MKKTIIIYLLLITAHALLFTGCKKDDSPVNNTTPTAQIIPLSVDNSWQYANTLYDTSGNIVQQFNSVNKIIGDTIINGKRWYYFDKNALYFSVSQDGYYFRDQYASDSLKEKLTYKYPCNKYDTYSYWQVANCDTAITVARKTYNCIFYKYRMKTSDSFGQTDIFIKPGVGIIKIIGYGYIPNLPIFQWHVTELTDYNIK